MRLAFAALSLFLLLARPASAGMLNDALEWLGIDDAKSAYDAHDYATAMRRYRVLAAKTDLNSIAIASDAAWHIGVMYRMGLGVPKNPVEALHWFFKASGSRNSVAEYDIGTMYEEGEGVTKNKGLALHWYCLAMMHGYLDAVGDINELAPESVGEDLDQFCMRR